MNLLIGADEKYVHITLDDFVINMSREAAQILCDKLKDALDTNVDFTKPMSLLDVVKAYPEQVALAIKNHSKLSADLVDHIRG